MRSNAIVAKHPLHPMLVTLPIGGFAFALIGDLAYLGTRAPFWHEFAGWAMGFGIIGGALAALPGLVDYLTVVPSDAKPTATRHMVVNLSTVGLFVVNLLLRWRLGATAGAALGWTTALTIIGVGALLYAGWLGAHLVYHGRIAVEEPGRPEDANFRITLSPQEAERLQSRR